MKTDLSSAMTAGVFVEFFDAEGHCVGQAAFADWAGKPLPDVGDLLVCPAASTSTAGAARKLSGHVRARHVDIQRDDQGRVCVWVRLEVDTAKQTAPSSRASRGASAGSESSRTEGTRAKKPRASGSQTEPTSNSAATNQEPPRRSLFDIWFSQN